MAQEAPEDDEPSHWERFLGSQPPAGSTPWLAELGRTADAVRQLVAAMATTEAPDAALVEAATRCREVLELLQTPSGDPTRGRRGRRSVFDTSPMMGGGNPLSAPMVLRPEGDAMVGEVTFHPGYEGPRGNVHGGVVAGVMDELLALAATMQGRGGYTGYLTTRYRSLTPLGRPLRLEAQVTSTEGRKVVVTGRILDGDVVTCEAEALFIAPRPG